ncbi:MAG: T9SS type A sorting domain-containing protein [Crocinitomicaceae bacterium]
MIKSIAILLLFMPLIIIGQDTIVPMMINPYLEDNFQTKSGGSLDSTFQYNYSNLDIPIFDDFSTNKWAKYITDFTAPNVSSILYYYLFDIDNGIPVDPSQGLCDSSAAHKKTVIINGGVVIDSAYTYFSPGISVLVNDLECFPISGSQKTLFTECYILIDSLVDGSLQGDQDTIFNAPTYVQDSARIFTADITNSEIWIDDYACHNYRFAFEPKSLGVATLDGVSNNGYPYEFGSPNAYGDADVLTSKPINLFGKTNVFISFLYQAKGLGNSPEALDSLMLEMYAPNIGDGTWFTMWSVDGNVNDNEWNSAHIEISASSFLQNGFQFRFTNKASTSGQLDHWHIDYVHLRENSSVNDTIIDDLAISLPIESFLKTYTSVPWDHYNNVSNPSTKMIDNHELLVMNNNTQAKLTNAGQVNADGGVFNLPVASPNWSVGSNIYNFNVSGLPYSFAQNNAIDKADFDVKVNIATSSTNQITENDTTYFIQQFRNYYAYDDGSAESGYGVLNSNAQIAYGFEAYEADTITGILMKFVPNVTDVSGNVILITIWEDSSGFPGQVLYKDDFFEPHFPNYAAAKEQYTYYTFNDNKAVPVPSQFFIGFEQIEDENLFLGFDMNNNNQDKIFYNTGGAWVNASFPGSLIMRPVFSTALNYTLDVEPVLPEPIEFIMYPNPVNDILTVADLPQDYVLQLFDIAGKEMIKVAENRIDFSPFNSGFYIVNVLNQMGNVVYSQKIIKQ